MNKEFYLKEIIESLSTLRTQVSLRNSINLYDINILSESFYSNLINIITDWNLCNANSIEKNAPSIDLFDDTNKIAIQVTSTNDSKKINNTITKFISNKLYEKYNRLVILMLSNKKKYTSNFDTQNTFSFNKEKDIWDIENIISMINTLQTPKIKKIFEYLKQELNNKYEKRTITTANEIETIIALIEYITKHKQKRAERKTFINPFYKINVRFKEFADRIINLYQALFEIYGSALEEIEKNSDSDEIQELLTKIYLQDLSIQHLDSSNNDPIKALNSLVDFFYKQLSLDGKTYDTMAIKFYLMHEIIKCNVFPNEIGDKYESKS